MIKDRFVPVKLKLNELKRFIESFLETLEGKAPETVVTYQRSLRAFLRFFVLDRHFFFRVRDVERFKQYLIQQQKLKEATVATYMTALRRFCQFLEVQGVLEKNPARRVIGGRRPKRYHRTFLTKEELTLLLEALQGDNESDVRDRLIVYLMLVCGLSEREIRFANVGDVQQQGRKWVLYVQGKGRKTKDEVVELPRPIVKELQRYLNLRQQSETVTEESPLVVSYSNRSRRKRMTLRGVRAVVTEKLQICGIKQERRHVLTPFSLRHTGGIILAKSNVPVEVLMQRLRIKWQPTALQYYKMRDQFRGTIDTQLYELFGIKSSR